MATACLVGSTGLVGSHILTTLTAHQSFNKVLAYTRKDLPSDPKVTPITSSDSSDWPSLFPNDTPICFSALGTTRARAGGLDKQRSIDLDLNLAIAKAAKERGTKVYVLISSHGANAASMIPYTKLKGEIEEGVKAIGFEHCVILRPGLIVGERGSHDSRPAEFVIRKVATLMGGVSMRLQDPWAQDVEVIARAAVTASLTCLNDKEEEKCRVLDQADIVRLGRTEWKS